MSTSTLLDRARQLIQKTAPGAALVIVPLAIAASAHAGSVDFTLSSAVTSNASGGDFGHATGTPLNGGQAIQLDGDTRPPAYNDHYPAPPIEYLTAHQAITGAGDVSFHWKGAFTGGSVTSSDYLHFNLDVNLLPLPSGTEPIGDVTWKLFITVNDAADGTGTDLASYETPVALGLGTFSVADTRQFIDGTPLFWSADLAAQWDVPSSGSDAVQPEDQLSITPSLVLFTDQNSESTEAPPTSAPLPSTFLTGTTMLAAVGLFHTARRRKLKPAI